MLGRQVAGADGDSRLQLDAESNLRCFALSAAINLRVLTATTVTASRSTAEILTPRLDIPVNTYIEMIHIRKNLLLQRITPYTE